MSIAPVGLTGKEAVEHHASQTEPNANDAMGGVIIPETSFTSFVHFLCVAAKSKVMLFADSDVR